MMYEKIVGSKRRVGKIFMGVLAMCALLCAGGCMSEEDKEELAKIEAQAKTNAVNYVSEKYGFEADVVNVKGETGADTVPVPRPTGYATVTFEYDDKEFNVYITGEEESSEGKDDYQSELIREDVKSNAMSALNIEAEDIYLDAMYNYASWSKEDIMTSTYYNGENMAQVLEEISCKFNYVVVTLNADLKNLDTGNMHTEFSECSEILILNCADEADFESLKEADIEDLCENVDEYTKYMDDYVHITSSKSEYTNVE